MDEFSFRVAGKVRGQGRPRFNKRGVYKSPHDVAYERNIRERYEKAGGPLFAGPVDVSIEVNRTLPRSRPKKVESEPDTFKPDCDNIAKSVLDALNGVAWEDDSQIVLLTVRKNDRARVYEDMVITIGGDAHDRPE